MVYYKSDIFGIKLEQCYEYQDSIADTDGLVL